MNGCVKKRGGLNATINAQCIWMQNLMEISFLLSEMISLHDLTKLWADTDATNAKEKGTEAHKKGGDVKLPPKMPTLFGHRI